MHSCVPPIAFGGTAGMKAPATPTCTVSIKIGMALRSCINQTVPKAGSDRHN
jgi:hypothetical protein